MAGRFEATTVIDRPVEEVFDFLADGTNDPKFSPRVLEIAKATDGPVGAGTVYKSTVKDAGVKTQREFEITEQRFKVVYLASIWILPPLMFLSGIAMWFTRKRK